MKRTGCKKPIQDGKQSEDKKNANTTDIYSPEKRSAIMSRVRGRDTAPELIVRSLLHRIGFRFRLHDSKLPGKPDIVLPKHQKVIFVHGCFWHQHPGCPRAKLPQTRSAWWQEKLTRNHQRDLENQVRLQNHGWKVLIIWQCQLKDFSALETNVREFLGKK